MFGMLIDCASVVVDMMLWKCTLNDMVKGMSTTVTHNWQKHTFSMKSYFNYRSVSSEKGCNMYIERKASASNWSKLIMGEDHWIYLQSFHWKYGLNLISWNNTKT